MRRHQIIACFDPATPVAFVADGALRALADEINLAVPLAVACTEWAELIKITHARLKRDAVQRVRLLCARASDNALFV